MKRNRVIVACSMCGKETSVPLSVSRTRKYCSNECKYKMMQQRQKGHLNHWLKEAAMPGWNKGVKMGPMSKETIKKRILSLKKNKLKSGYKRSKNYIFRRSLKYEAWRTSVFERDGFKCQDCGAMSGNGKAIYLNAHHIEPFFNNESLRLDINNGITLCKKCHKHIHNLFGWKQKCVLPSEL